VIVSPLRIATRVVVAYVVLLVLLRISGKRLLAEATGMQFVLAIMIGDLVDDGIVGEVPLVQFAVAAATLTLLQMAIAAAAARQPWVWKVLEGEPAPVLQNGTPQRKGMRHERINRKELASMLRLKGLTPAQWTEIQSARVDEGGVLGVIKHGWAKPAQRQDAEVVTSRLRVRRS
jgi:uncharacterized membrane protein YcaP (DUF421 family)